MSVNDNTLYIGVVNCLELRDKYQIPLYVFVEELVRSNWRILFHGNNKTIDEVSMVIKLEVGRFVVDNFYELDLIEDICKKIVRI